MFSCCFVHLGLFISHVWKISINQLIYQLSSSNNQKINTTQHDCGVFSWRLRKCVAPCFRHSWFQFGAQWTLRTLQWGSHGKWNRALCSFIAESKVAFKSWYMKLLVLLDFCYFNAHTHSFSNSIIMSDISSALWSKNDEQTLRTQLCSVSHQTRIYLLPRRRDPHISSETLKLLNIHDQYPKI